MIFLKVFFVHRAKLFSSQPFLEPFSKILVQKILYISLFIPVSACLKTFYSCHRVSGVLISILYFWLPGYTLGFGLCMHMLILTFAFHPIHYHTISAFSILANFQPCLKTISNNINQLGLVNHHLIYSCLKLYPIIIFSWAQPVTHYLFYHCLLYCCQSYLCFSSFISTPPPVVALLTYEGKTIFLDLMLKHRKGFMIFGIIIICNT